MMQPGSQPSGGHDDWVRKAFRVDPTGSGKGSAGPDAKATRRFHKSGSVWLATRGKVEGEIAKLCKSIMAVDHGGEFGNTLEQDFRATVEPILATLDESLGHTLHAAAKAKDPQAAAALKEQARKIIERYRAFVSGNAIIRELDRNPFVQIAIGKTLEASLSAVTAALR